MIELLHIGFVNEPREEILELSEDDIMSGTLATSTGKLSSATTDLQLDFWTAFVGYCADNGRTDDIGSRKPYGQNWYDVTIHKSEYHIFFSIIGKSILRIGLYIYNGEAFTRLENKKDSIEQLCGFNMEWYTSGEKSVAKRVLYSKTTNLYNKATYTDSFEWLIDCFDKLKNALDTVD